MIGNNIPCKIKPKQGNGIQDFSLARHGFVQDHVKGGYPVRRDYNESVGRYLVHIPYLPLNSFFTSRAPKTAKKNAHPMMPNCIIG